MNSQNNQIYTELDLNLDNVIQKLFNEKEPPAPNQIQIIFDIEEIPPNMKYGLYIFEQMIIIFVKGLQIRYQKDVININDISPEEFWYIQQYFKGIGIQLNCDIEEILDEKKINEYLDNMDDKLPSLDDDNTDIVKHNGKISQIRQKNNTSGDNLNDYYFLLSTDSKRYKISFDYYLDK